jgi:hypothetical protein
LRVVDMLCVGLVGAALAWRLTSVDEPARRTARDRFAA